MTGYIYSGYSIFYPYMSSIQTLDTTTTTKNDDVSWGSSQYKIHKCNVLVDTDMLIKMKQIAAAKHYKSMSEMVRYVMEQYLKAEGM